MADRIPFLDRLRSEITAAIDRRAPAPRPAGGLPRALGLALAGAAVVVVIVGVGVLFNARNPEPQPAGLTTTTVPPLASTRPEPATTTTVPATAPPAAATSAPPPPPAPLRPREWMPLPDITGAFGSEAGGVVMSGVAAVGGGYLAWGHAEVGGANAAAMWASTDGLVWHRVGVPEDRDAYVGGVTRYGDRLAAVGGVGETAAFWVGDGDGWVRVAFAAGEPRAGESAVLANAVVAVDGRLVATGNTFTPLGRAETGRGVVWVSADGEAWERVDDPVFGPSEDGTVSLGGAAVDGRRVVVVGTEQGGQASSRPRAWVSDDAGSTWEEAEVEPGDGDGFTAMNGVAATPRYFVAVGYDQFVGDAAAVWLSTTGRTWQRVGHAGDVFGGGLDLGARMTAVVGASDRVIAAGTSRRGGRLGVGVWESADGTAWQQAVAPPSGWSGPFDSAAFGLAGRGRQAVMVGAESLVEGPSRGAVWVTPPGDLPENPPPPDSSVPVTPPTAPAAEPPPSDLDGGVNPTSGPSDSILELRVFGLRDAPRDDLGRIELFLVGPDGRRIKRVCSPPPDPFGQIACVVRLARPGELSPGTYRFTVGDTLVQNMHFVVEPDE